MCKYSGTCKLLPEPKEVESTLIYSRIRGGIRLAPLEQCRGHAKGAGWSWEPNDKFEKKKHKTYRGGGWLNEVIIGITVKFLAAQQLKWSHCERRVWRKEDKKTQPEAQGWKVVYCGKGCGSERDERAIFFFPWCGGARWME